MNKPFKLLYFLTILSLMKVCTSEAMELELNILARRLFAPSSYRFVLENTLASQASDASKPPFDGRCCLYTYARYDAPDIPVGAFYILTSQHNFPFIYLPEAFQKVTLRTDFLVNEINDVEDKKSHHGFKVERFSSPTNWHNWFDLLSKESRDLLRSNTSLYEIAGCDPADIKELDPLDIAGYYYRCTVFLGAHSYLPARDNPILKGYMERWAIAYHGGCRGLESMETQHTSAQSTLLEEEAATIEDTVSTINHFLFLTSEQREVFRKESMLSHTLEVNCESKSLIARNQYWIKNSFPHVPQPGKLGLVMFGMDHFYGKHGIASYLSQLYQQQRPLGKYILTGIKPILNRNPITLLDEALSIKGIAVPISLKKSIN